MNAVIIQSNPKVYPKIDNLNADALIKRHYGLIYNIVRKYGIQHKDDLFQEACIGFLHAIDKYDQTKGAKFSSYASFWIAQSANRGYQNLIRDVRLPLSLLENINKIKQMITYYMTEYHREPSAEEIAGKIGLKSQKVQWLIQLQSKNKSLDASNHNSDLRLAEILEDENSESFVSEMETRERNQYLSQAFALLNNKEELIIKEFFGFNGPERSLSDVAREIGLSRERVRQLKERALLKIKNSKLGEILKEYL